MCPGSLASRMVFGSDDLQRMIKPQLELPFVKKSCYIPRFAMLLLVVMLVIMTMLSTYPSLDAGSLQLASSSSSSRMSNMSARIVQPSSLAYDLLRYTNMDPSDMAEKSKIRQILEGTAPGNAHRFHGRYDWIDSRAGRVEQVDHSDSYERNSRSFYRRSYRGERWPPELTHPRFLPYLGQFRELLQTWARKKKYDPLVMKELLSSVKEPIDRHFNVGGASSGKAYRSCAVVGNSGILLNRTYGRLIDSHEMVMRLNNARINKFGPWVGTRTTLSFVNSNILHTCARRQKCSCESYHEEASEEVPMVSYICQVAHFIDVAYCGALHKAPLLVTDPRFDSLTTRIIRYYSLQHFFLKRQQQQQQQVQGPAAATATPSKAEIGTGYEEWSKAHDGALFHYSSGMQAVMLALGICEQVDIFGFGKLQDAKHHYHTNQKKELSLHDYEAEYVFYDDLAAGLGSLIPFLNDSGIVLPRFQIFR